MKIKISAVVPIFNEEGNIDRLYTHIKSTFKKIDKNFEILFVNDGSLDNSLTLLKKIAKSDRRVRVVSFSRNFGHMSAINAGLSFARGLKVAVMDADMQDPPRVIEKMYKKSLEGYDVVYGIKKKEKRKLCAKIFVQIFL